MPLVQAAKTKSRLAIAVIPVSKIAKIKKVQTPISQQRPFFQTRQALQSSPDSRTEASRTSIKIWKIEQTVQSKATHKLQLPAQLRPLLSKTITRSQKKQRKETSVLTTPRTHRRRLAHALPTRTTLQSEVSACPFQIFTNNASVPKGLPGRTQLLAQHLPTHRHQPRQIHRTHQQRRRLLLPKNGLHLRHPQRKVRLHQLA